MNSTTPHHSTSIRIPKSLVLAMLVFAGLCLTGCSNQMAIMQENQANLQVLVEENARQMSDLVACMEQSQQELKVTIQNLRETTRTLSADMALVTQAHTDLKDTVQQRDAVMTKRVDSVEKGQRALSTEVLKTAEKRQILAASIANEQEARLALEQEVQDNQAVFLTKISNMQGSQVALQSELKTLKATIQTAVADISTVAAAQATMEEALAETVAGHVSKVQQVQAQQQTQLDYSTEQIDKLLAGLTGLETNLTQLERILKQDISNVTKAVELANEQVQGQIEVTQKVTDVQSDTNVMIENLKDDLQEVKTLVSEISAVQMNDPEVLSSEEAAP